jgi:hypothetical protein
MVHIISSSTDNRQVVFARDDDSRQSLDILQEWQSKLAARTFKEGIGQEDFPANYKVFKRG